MNLNILITPRKKRYLGTMLFKYLKWMALAFLLCITENAIAQSLGPELIIDGHFNNPNYTGGSQVFPANWVTSGSTNGIHRSNGRSDGTGSDQYYPIGGWSGGMGGSVAQTLTTQPGSIYEVGFHHGFAFRSGGVGEVTAESTTGNQTLATINLSTINDYKVDTFRFTANDTQTTLKFTQVSANSGDWDWDIDAVSLKRVLPPDVPDPTEFCRTTDGVNRTQPSIYWDTEPHGAPGGLRYNYVPDIITSASNTTSGVGISTSNNGSNSQFIHDINATIMGDARLHEEYLEQSFTIQGNYAAYLDYIFLYRLTTDGYGVDIATQSDFSDAVNVYDGTSPPSVGWQRDATKERQILLPGQIYYLRFYFYGADTNNELIDGWGISVGGCMDFGDAPIDKKAFHIQAGELFLGALPGDIETSSHLGVALGDDKTDIDDEDGVKISHLILGTTQEFKAAVSGKGYLQAWIDFNGNGSFSDAGEQIALDIEDNGAGDLDPSVGTVNVSFSVPAGSTTDPIYARFRWSSTTGLDSAEIGYDGEIEDYPLTILSGGELDASKTVSSWDPTNSGVYAIPGNDVIYAITVKSIGDGPVDNDTIELIDKMPPEVIFYNGDIDDAGPETNPVQFTDSGSGLTFTYSSDTRYADTAAAPANFSQCNYTPSPGYDEDVTYICLNPKGIMSSGGPDLSFVVSFRAQIR